MRNNVNHNSRRVTKENDVAFEIVRFEIIGI